MEERPTENREVTGSTPVGGTGREAFAVVAQLVERHLAKVEVAGSSPVNRSKVLLRQAAALGWFRPVSSVVERTLGKGEAAGSTPAPGSTSSE